PPFLEFGPRKPRPHGDVMLLSVAAWELNRSAQRAVRYKESAKGSGSICPWCCGASAAQETWRHELETRCGKPASRQRSLEAISERGERLVHDREYGVPASVRVCALLLLRRHHQLERCDHSEAQGALHAELRRSDDRT